MSFSTLVSMCSITGFSGAFRLAGSSFSGASATGLGFSSALGAGFLWASRSILSRTLMVADGLAGCSGATSSSGAGVSTTSGFSSAGLGAGALLGTKGLTSSTLVLMMTSSGSSAGALALSLSVISFTEIATLRDCSLSRCSLANSFSTRAYASSESTAPGLASISIPFFLRNSTRVERAMLNSLTTLLALIFAI